MTENLLNSSNDSTDQIFPIVSNLIRVSKEIRESTATLSLGELIMDDYTSHIDSMLDTISVAFAQRMNQSMKAVNSSSIKQKPSIGKSITANNFLCRNKPDQFLTS